MAQHYSCCTSPCGDATLVGQTAILAAIAAVSQQIDDHDTSGGGGGGTATGAKQTEILDEIKILTTGLQTY